MQLLVSHLHLVVSMTYHDHGCILSKKQAWILLLDLLDSEATPHVKSGLSCSVLSTVPLNDKPPQHLCCSRVFIQCKRHHKVYLFHIHFSTVYTLEEEQVIVHFVNQTSLRQGLLKYHDACSIINRYI